MLGQYLMWKMATVAEQLGIPDDKGRYKAGFVDLKSNSPVFLPDGSHTILGKLDSTHPTETRYMMPNGTVMRFAKRPEGLAHESDLLGAVTKSGSDIDAKDALKWWLSQQHGMNDNPRHVLELLGREDEVKIKASAPPPIQNGSRTSKTGAKTPPGKNPPPPHGGAPMGASVSISRSHAKTQLPKIDGKLARYLTGGAVGLAGLGGLGGLAYLLMRRRDEGRRPPV